MLWKGLIVNSDFGSTNHDHANPNYFASPMQCLINNQLIAKTAFTKINQKVNEHFCEAKNGYTSQQSNDEAMGAGMG